MKWIPHPNDPLTVLYPLPGGTYIHLRQLKGDRWQVICGEYGLIYSSKNWRTARMAATLSVEEWMMRCLQALKKS